MQNLSFQLSPYHHVAYLGECGTVIQYGKYGAISSLLNPLSTIPAFAFNFVGFILSVLAVFAISCKAKTHLVGQSIIWHCKSSGSLSLLILFTCECLTACFLIAGMSIALGLRSTPRTPVNPIGYEPPNMRFLVFPVIQNLFSFFLDLGILGRNWCLYFIMLAATQTMLKSSNSKPGYTFLRHRNFFLMLFFLMSVISFGLAYVKQAGSYGALCFDKRKNQYALWAEHFLLSAKQRLIYNIVYTIYQTGFIWLSALIFSLAHVVKHYACRREETLPQVINTEGNKALLSLAVAFICFQILPLITAFLSASGVVTAGQLQEVLYTVNNTAIGLHTIVNFFILYFSIGDVRDAVTQLATPYVSDVPTVPDIKPVEEVVPPKRQEEPVKERGVFNWL